MFGAGRGFRGFRPRNSTSQGVHLGILTVIGVTSGYYIFSEPLKRAVMEVKAKEARDRAAAGGGSGSTGSGGSSSSSRSDGSSSSDEGGGESSAAAANGR